MKQQILKCIEKCGLILSGDADGGNIRFRITGEGIKHFVSMGLVGDGDTFGNSDATLKYFRGFADTLSQKDYRYEGIVNFPFNGEGECEIHLDGFLMALSNGHRKHNTIHLASSIIMECLPDEVGLAESGWLRLWWD